MEGKVDPGFANHLADTVPLAELAEHGELIDGLTRHPGWALLMGFLGEAHDRGNERLKQQAHRTALSTDPDAAVKYAEKSGVLNGMEWIPDAVETVLVKARQAAERLRNDAAPDRAAEEVN